jgi:membrane protease YdiL (CAAX protease family)
MTAGADRDAVGVEDGLPYHRIQEAGRPGLWRPILGLVLMMLGFVAIGAVVATLVFVLVYAVTGQGTPDVTRLADLEHPTPAGLAFLNVALATFIPLAMLGERVLHGVGALVPDQGSDVSTHANAFTTTTFHYLLVIVFLTPFQAAGEEYVFRGYLTQAFGGVFHRAWVAVLVPAFLFGLAHGLGQSPPVFFDRFAFGLVAGVLVIMTGGLEAGIAMHVLNNFLAYGLALAFGDMASTLNPTGSSWWNIPVTLTQSLVYLVLAVLVARRMGLAVTTNPRVLEAPRSRV